MIASVSLTEISMPAALSVLEQLPFQTVRHATLPAVVVFLTGFRQPETRVHPRVALLVPRALPTGCHRAAAILSRMQAAPSLQPAATRQADRQGDGERLDLEAGLLVSA
jgi:hypothetical protein